MDVGSELQLLRSFKFLGVWITKVNGAFHTDVYSKGLFILAGLARLTGLTQFFCFLWGLKYSGELKLQGIAALSNMKACHQAK